MGLLRRAKGIIGGRRHGGRDPSSRLEAAPDQKPKRRSLLSQKPSKEDEASARVVVSRSIARAGRRYTAGMRKPLNSNGREKALSEARYLVAAATEMAEQFGFVDEIVNAPGITALRAKLFPQGKPPPPPPQTSSKRGGKTTDPSKRRARGWGPAPREVLVVDGQAQTGPLPTIADLTDAELATLARR